VEKTPVGLSTLFEPVRVDLEQVEREFVRHVQSHVALIPEIGRYIQGSGGKRVRPAVLLMAGRLCGVSGDLAVQFASVVEFIHSATLVHDDIVDDASLRRGRQAVHSRWGNDVTVLLGDYLYIKSMAMALQHDVLPIIRVLCDTTLGMIEGEIYQLSKNGDIDITEEEHFEIVRRKTAYLFGGCAQIGGMLGGAGTAQQEALRAYGLNLGMTFQIVDDVLDLTGSEEIIGKPVASDLRDGKMTLPLIYALRRDGRNLRPLVDEVVRDRQLDGERWQRISASLDEHQAIGYALEKAAAFGRQAQDDLTAAFPPSPEREALAALPDYVLSRDR
jgi:octaprenyl-diphosphate synthase